MLKKFKLYYFYVNGSGTVENYHTVLTHTGWSSCPNRNLLPPFMSHGMYYMQ